MGLLDGLFGSSKSESSVPGWVKEPIMQNVRNAQRVAGIGYTPYYGPDVAAFTPMQNAAFDGTNMAASAFGLPSASGNGMPKPQEYGRGIQGYSSAPMFEEALRRLQKNSPQQYDRIMSVLRSFRQQAQPPQQAMPVVFNGGSSGGSSGSYTAQPTSGGFTGLRDMFDGGGAGASGSTFSGGPFSNTLNNFGISPIGRR